MLDSGESDSDEVYRSYISHSVYGLILCIFAYTGYFGLMVFFFFFGVTLVTTAEDAQEDDIFVDEDETEAYHHAMMESEMFREYFDDQTDLTLGEGAGIEIMPMDMDELLDSVTEDPVIEVPKSFDIFFRRNYNLLTSIHTIENINSNLTDIIRIYGRNDYMPHHLHLYTTKRMDCIDYHDLYYKTPDWEQVKTQGKQISEEETKKKYQNSMLMASVFDQGLHGIREYDFYSFHPYDYIEIFDLLTNLNEISDLDDQDEGDEYMEVLKSEGELGQFKMPKFLEQTQPDILSDEDLSLRLEDMIYGMRNASIPNIANHEFDEDFFENHLNGNFPNISVKYAYMKYIFLNNVNISYANIAYSPVLSISHCHGDVSKGQVINNYYDGVF